MRFQCLQGHNQKYNFCILHSKNQKSTDRDVKLSMSFMRPLGDIAYHFGNTIELNLTFLMR